MEDTNLVGLFENDREMILASLGKDRSPAASQAALEKALDRIMLRAAEQYSDSALRDGAQLALSSIKSALPLMDSIGEVRRWQKSTAAASKRRDPGLLAWVALIGGAVITLAAIMGMAFVSTRGSLMVLLKAVIPAAAGMAAIFWSGTRFAAPKPAAPAEPSDVRDEYLVDPERVLHHLRGMLLVADNALEGIRGRRAAEAARDAREVGQAPLERNQVELFAGLLENAYAQHSADAGEMAESIRFYLHGAQIDVVDYEKGRENWFEFLPAQRPGTIRPALVNGDRLVKKGLASA